MMFLMIIIGFAYQVFIVYSTASTVSTAVQRAIMSVASVNMPSLFDSLREGEASFSYAGSLVTVDELTQALTTELGVQVSGTDLVRESSSGGWFYRIRELGLTAENVSASPDTVRYTANFVLEIPVAEYWGFGSFDIPMQVAARYASKY